ncbi:hypothetical protein GGR42_002758 [Saonia flava]|uniref:WbqC-like protein family protein n=1 Tax=Saonia flava TaxID=523696 RepID=A0A846QYI5_9FLAO|nr:WbqC family protein [Saonia flava]NJB72267.1 hypothetical protein [Saonia flava]
MKVLLHPGYFPNIANFAVMVQQDICWEVEDNYQKQTYRNRSYVCTDSGKHLLSIPIKHIGFNIHGKQKYKDVKIENEYNWQRQHWRTLQTAYRTSPFFEYYEDDLAPLFKKHHTFLLDFNMKTIQCIHECLQIKMPTGKTETYVPSPKHIKDGRFLVNAKNNLEFVQEEYTQVFNDRHPFIKNVSILDLLFNEGPNAVTYLKNINLDFLND